MKITKTQLKQIIKEELERVMNEDMPRRAHNEPVARQTSVQQQPGLGHGEIKTSPETEFPKAIEALLKRPNNSLSKFVEADPRTADPEIVKKAVDLLKKMLDRYRGASHSFDIFHKSNLRKSGGIDKPSVEAVGTLKSIEKAVEELSGQIDASISGAGGMSRDTVVALHSALYNLGYSRDRFGE